MLLRSLIDKEIDLDPKLDFPFFLYTVNSIQLRLLILKKGDGIFYNVKMIILVQKLDLTIDIIFRDTDRIRYGYRNRQHLKRKTGANVIFLFKLLPFNEIHQ